MCSSRSITVVGSLLPYTHPERPFVYERPLISVVEEEPLLIQQQEQTTTSSLQLLRLIFARTQIRVGNSRYYYYYEQLKVTQRTVMRGTRRVVFNIRIIFR